jgi:hypothetical protein
VLAHEIDDRRTYSSNIREKPLMDFEL